MTDQAAAYRQALAEAQAAWQGGVWGEDPPPAITAAAGVFGLDVKDLYSYAEGTLGWEPHDEGYADRVYLAARELAA